MSLTRSLTGGVAGAIVSAYRSRYPDVELVLSLGTTMLHVEQLHAGEIDVGFVRPPLGEPGLDELVLGREPMVCVLPRGHRLTRRTTVRPADLRGEPLVWWPEEHGPGAWREVRREVCGDPPWPPLARAEPEEERIVMAVAEGAGISFIMLERSRSLRIPGAVYRRFAPPEPTMGIAIAWRRGDDLPTVARFGARRVRRRGFAGLNRGVRAPGFNGGHLEVGRGGLMAARVTALRTPRHRALERSAPTLDAPEFRADKSSLDDLCSLECGEPPPIVRPSPHSS